ncbi:MAG: hypothetical protein Q8R82_10645 [Hyphomonadaceae bacterium]|nr:hypothetical protein [Hyphomonadaceae bacterium]
MRGLWDNEQPVSPSLLRSALALAGGFLALTSIVMLFLAVGSVVAEHYVVAGLQLAFGIALPFAIWLGLRMMADILVVLNRSHDRLEGIEDALAGRAALAPRQAPHTGPVAERASDDGPAYPAED